MAKTKCTPVSSYLEADDHDVHDLVGTDIFMPDRDGLALIVTLMKEVPECSKSLGAPHILLSHSRSRLAAPCTLGLEWKYR